MYDDLFLKSLDKNKKKYDLTDRIKRTFKERNREKFQPKKDREVNFFNPEVVKSKIDKKLKFTNFYSNTTHFAVKERINELSEDLSIIRDCIPEEVNLNDRIIDIIKLFIPDFEVQLIEDDQIMKVRLENQLGQQDGVRIYYLLNEKFDAYEIIIIDLFHLVIPSRLKVRNKILSKGQAMNKVFQENVQNDICISTLFGLEVNT